MNAQQRKPAGPNSLLRSLVALLALASLSAHAVELLSTTNLVVEGGSRLEEELWLLADEVVIDGAAADDVLALSRTFDLAGSAEGDLWILAEQVVLSGEARQQVRVAAQSLVVSGRVDRSLAAVGATIQVASNAVVGGDALLAADTVTVQGAVRGDLRLAANHVTLQGHVGGDVRVFANDIALLPGAVIEGNLVYTSDRDLVPGKGVTIVGEVEHRALPAQQISFGRRATAVLFRIMAALLTGLVALRLFPGLMGRGARLARHVTGRCILLGVAVLLAVPFVSLLGILVTVTRPLSLMAGGLLLALVYLGKIVVALVLGSALLRYRGEQGFGQAVGALAAGLAVLYILSALPTIGLWVWLAASTLGLGALIAAAMARAAPPPVPLGDPPPAGGPPEDLDRSNT